jgi:hypothetical protein
LNKQYKVDTTEIQQRKNVKKTLKLIKKERKNHSNKHAYTRKMHTHSNTNTQKGEKATSESGSLNSLRFMV